MIQATDLRKSYEKLQVLRGVSLSIEAGEVLAIVGKSGAGKSTLLHILGTLDRADAGSLQLKGSDISKLNARQLAEFRNKHLGFVFQFHHLLPEFTALENVCVPAYIGGKSQKETEKRGMELLDYLGLSERAQHKPSAMSGGEQQRVSVARALINQPAVIFADEPSGNLDTQTSQELHQLFFQLRKDFNQTFVIVTHNMELAALCDRTLTMKDGEVVGSK